MGGSVVIGVLLAVTASFMNALGLNLQRLGQNDPSKAGLNGLGIALASSSGLVDLVSFGFAPQSLLAPLSAVTLIANLVLAPVIHNEKLLPIDLMATALVCCGIAGCLIFGPGESPAYTVTDLKHLALRPTFLIFLACYFTVLVGVVVHVQTEERKGRGHQKDVAVGYPVVSGMLGGMTILHAKLLTELLKLVSLKTHLYIIVPIVALLVFFAVSQVTVLNMGIGKHSSLFVVPLFSASILLSNLSAGMMFFDELRRFQLKQLIGFFFGVALVVVGVSALATKEEEVETSKGEKRSSRKRSSERTKDKSS